jgi:hypothetical protein
LNKPKSWTIFSVLTLVLVASLVVPVLSKPGNGNNNPNKELGPQSYLLNILGKKWDWNGDPGIDPDRRSIFIPENIEEFLLNKGYGEEEIRYITVKKGNTFSVQDPNMFDDGECIIKIPNAKQYRVFFVALGKPGMKARLEGWTYNASDNTYMFNIGNVTIEHGNGGKGGQPVWVEGEDMMWVSYDEALAGLGPTIMLNWPVGVTAMYIFDFLEWLSYLTVDADGVPLYEYLYLWKLGEGGCKHIQVRFYEI